VERSITPIWPAYKLLLQFSRSSSKIDIVIILVKLIIILIEVLMNINHFIRVGAIFSCAIIPALANQHSEPQDFIEYQAPPLVPNNSAIGQSELVVFGPVMVREGEFAVVEKFRKFKKTANPGLHYYAPLATRIIRISLQTILVDTPHQEVYTKDKQKLVVDGSFFYRVSNPHHALYHVQNLEGSLKFLFSQAVMTQLGQMNSESALTLDKNFFSNQLLATLNKWVKGSPQNEPIHNKENKSDKTSSIFLEEEHLPLEEIKDQENKSVVEQSILGSNDRDWGIVFTKVAITNIAYPQSIMNAMNTKRETEYKRQIEEIQSQTKVEKAQKETEIYVLELKSKAQGELIQNQAKNEVQLLEAENYAKSLKIRTQAEMEKHELQAKFYHQYPELLELEKLKILAESFQEIGKSPSSKLIFQNKNDPQSLYTQLFALGTLPSLKKEENN
jgi:regulator of protease activity HflC (stomatin/prohibitin superfamily)